MEGLAGAGWEVVGHQVSGWKQQPLWRGLSVSLTLAQRWGILPACPSSLAHDCEMFCPPCLFCRVRYLARCRLLTG